MNKSLKTDGSIKAWGDSGWGGTGAPTDKGYTEIYSNALAFVTSRIWIAPCLD
jgi:lysophospholipase L1-like esterase